MSNALNQFRFLIKSKLSLIPGTLKIEREDNRIREEYRKLQEYEATGEPGHYLELKSFVISQDFKDRKKEINSQRFENTEAYARLQEFKEMKNSSGFKNYLKFLNSPYYEGFKKYENSEELKKHEELRDYVHSHEFAEKLRGKFESTEDYRKYLDYKKLKSTPEIFHYYEVKHSKDYPAFEKFHDSKEFKLWEKLDSVVHSAEFQTMKKSMKSDEFKGSPEYKKYEEYNLLMNDPNLKAYIRLKNSKPFGDFLLLRDSAELKEFENLEKFVNSGGLEKAKKDFSAQIIAEKQKLNQFKTEKSSGKFKGYYTLRNSKMYNDFKQLENSKELKRFKELEKYIQSDEFKGIEKYMKSSDKFKKSEEYHQLLEYKTLNKSSKIRWYFKEIKCKKYDEVRKYDITFFDDFEGKSLDKKKWITSYYWGNKLLKEGYSPVEDAHLLTNGENVVLENGIARIITKKENAVGKAWDAAIGFYPKDFNYTSGIISSGESFRQRFGIFEAKVKLNANPSVFHSFWMLSDKMVPHVDIFRFKGKNKSRIELNYFWGDASPAGSITKEKASVSGVEFSKGFNIIRLEWYTDRLVWKLNNQVVNVQTTNVPQEEMYISFSSGIIGKEAQNLQNVSMEIDWVRCQKLKDKLPAK